MSFDDGDQIIPFPEDDEVGQTLDKREPIVFTIDDWPEPIRQAGYMLLAKAELGEPMGPYHVRARLHNTPDTPHLISFTSTGEAEITSEPGKRQFEQIRCLAIPLNDAVMYYEYDRKITKTDHDKNRVSHDNARLVQECYIALKGLGNYEFVFTQTILTVDPSLHSIKLENDYQNKEIDQTYHHIIPQEAVKIIRAIAKEKSTTFEEAAEGIIPYRNLARALGRNWDHPLNFMVISRAGHDLLHHYPDIVQEAADNHSKTKAGKIFLGQDNRFAFHKEFLEQKQTFWYSSHDRVMTAMTTIMLFMAKGAGEINYMNQGPSSIHPESQFYWDIAALHDEIYEEDPDTYIEAMRVLILGGVVPPDLAADYLGFDSENMGNEQDIFMDFIFNGTNEIFKRRIKNKMKEPPQLPEPPDNIA